ncbi:glycosyltransferase family 4 protein [Hydrogenophaga sp.]|uniref:glycosyltransferase family 4 protein n=1 Tax=Hydrogenophaga sp. TaxID=1904254 RepID=UPI0035ADF1DE
MVAPRLKSRPLELICAAMMHNHSKGHHYLIDSVRCLMLKNINVSCTLIGEGRIRRELEEYSTLIGVSDRIRFLGLIPSSSEVQRLISTADVFVLPSFQEGLPRSLIEALASGTICIGSNAGGIPEVLPHSLIFEKGDTESLSTLVEKLATCNDFYKKAIVDCMDAFDSFAPASLDRMQKTYVEELCL